MSEIVISTKLPLAMDNDELAALVRLSLFAAAYGRRFIDYSELSLNSDDSGELIDRLAKHGFVSRRDDGVRLERCPWVEVRHATAMHADPPDEGQATP